jgi:hypothetical protein
VVLAGLTTIGAPTASDGATLCATRFSGKLNGVIPSTGPIAKRRMSPIRDPSEPLGVQPHHSSSAVADQLGRPAERRGWRASPRRFAHFSGFPPSRAISSRVLVEPLGEPLRDVVEGVRAGVHRQVLALSNVSAAVAAASSTSSAVGTPISSTTLSSYGLWTSNEPSPVRQSPFTR